MAARTPDRRAPRRRKPVGGARAADLAETFRSRRLALGLTQQTVADLAGLHRSTVVELESGRGATTVTAAVKVAEVLGVRLTLGPRTENAGG